MWTLAFKVYIYIYLYIYIFFYVEEDYTGLERQSYIFFLLAVNYLLYQLAIYSLTNELRIVA